MTGKPLPAWAATAEVDVLEPITPAPEYGSTYLHLYETCPAVKRAIARDGGILRYRMLLSQAASSVTPMCGVCWNWWIARNC